VPYPRGMTDLLRYDEDTAFALADDALVEGVTRIGKLLAESTG